MTSFFRVSINGKSWELFADRELAMRLVHRTRHRYPEVLGHVGGVVNAGDWLALASGCVLAVYLAVQIGLIG